MVIGIIGGGASGMAAALAAAEKETAQVLLFERQARVGRKLLATGNGRCNLTNLHTAPEHYYGEEADFAAFALERYDVENTLRWFRKMGLYTVAEPSGRVYPYSDQANSVVDVLRFALQKPNIQVLTGFEVTKVRKNHPGFTVENGEETYHCDKLIIACGGLAGTKLGGSMSGYKLLQKLGHRCTKLRPTLVQIKSDWSALPSLKGVRANCLAEIYRDDQLHSSSRGELQFTEFGISGPVIFEISRDVCHQKGNWTCKLDLLPDREPEELFQLIRHRRDTDLTAEDLLTGILHNRLGRIVVKETGIAGYVPIRQLEDAELLRVCEYVNGLSIPLIEPMGMDAAQVTAGGILTSEFDPETMESRIVPGLYACGEVLDIDGDCGGYNLQWAWSSGRCAGDAAGKE
ncbi:MAG: NAD(P)/FAD-dependent oxidoreductase [Oscillospiraceae bacterium]|nr:NAD(P)/FAD-dependent oxidoreductase [Oscillospiraceae bacterium]